MSCLYYFKQLFLHAPSKLDQDISKIEFIIVPEDNMNVNQLKYKAQDNFWVGSKIHSV